MAEELDSLSGTIKELNPTVHKNDKMIGYEF
jgi:hypothetical protein